MVARVRVRAVRRRLVRFMLVVGGWWWCGGGRVVMGGRDRGWGMGKTVRDW